MTTTSVQLRQRAIRLSERVREDPDLAEKLGIRVDFQETSKKELTGNKDRKGADHESE